MSSRGRAPGRRVCSPASLAGGSAADATREEVLHPGEMYEIGNFRMHLHKLGPSNNLPPVVIEAGNSMSGAAYSRIQMALAQRVQAVTYDRAGLGWSEDSSDPKDAEHICEHLHLLLNRAGVKRPFVIVGHSIGGLFSRVYAGKFPAEVSGVVFLDASHPRVHDILGERDWLSKTKEFYRLQKRAVLEGSLHASDLMFIEDFADMPEVQKQLRFAAMRVLRYDVGIQTSEAFDKSAAQAESHRSLGDRPVLSITAPVSFQLDGSTNEDNGGYAARKVALHRELAELSTRGHHIQIEEAEHGTIVSNRQYANTVSEEILKLVREAANAYD